MNIDARGLGTSLNNLDTLLERYNSATWSYAEPPWSTEFPDLVNLLNGTKENDREGREKEW
jgi:hypothetical protein